jgi:nicotinamidase-related amidase
LVLDLQNEFVGSRPLFPVAGAAELLRLLPPFVAAVRRMGVQTVFTRYVAPEGETMSPARAASAAGTGGAHRGEAARLVPAVQVAVDDVVLEKSRQSAFFRTGLDEWLRVHGIDTVLIAGVTTNVCCLATAIDAAARDYFVVMLADLTRASEPTDSRGSRIPAGRVQEDVLALVAHTLGEVDTAVRVLERLVEGEANA